MFLGLSDPGSVGLCLTCNILSTMWLAYSFCRIEAELIIQV